MRGRILVVIQHRDQRAEVLALLRRLDHEVDEAEEATTALAAVRERSPDLVVLDVDSCGLELCREIVERSEVTSVILISADRTSSADRVAGLLAGADDYICVPFDPDELLARARRTLERHTPSPQTRSAPQFAPTLSPREEEVLGLLAKGCTQREIASILVISHKTVGTHLQHILTKLGVHSRAQAIAYALGGGASRPASAVLSGRVSMVRPVGHDVEGGAAPHPESSNGTG
jgi:DNA-binding NarL/FixJ family response regulator